MLQQCQGKNEVTLRGLSKLCVLTKGGECTLIHKGSRALDGKKTKNSNKLHYSSCFYSTAEHSTPRKLF